MMLGRRNREALPQAGLGHVRHLGGEEAAQARLEPFCLSDASERNHVADELVAVAVVTAAAVARNEKDEAAVDDSAAGDVAKRYDVVGRVGGVEGVG